MQKVRTIFLKSIKHGAKCKSYDVAIQTYLCNIYKENDNKGERQENERTKNSLDEGKTS